MKITKQNNGILFDLTGTEGAGDNFAKKMFRPQQFASIVQISLYNNAVFGKSLDGRDFELNIKDVPNGFKVSEINGTQITNLEELFEGFISCL